MKAAPLTEDFRELVIACIRQRRPARRGMLREAHSFLSVGVLILCTAGAAVAQSGATSSPSQPTPPTPPPVIRSRKYAPTTRGPQIGHLGAISLFFDHYSAVYDGDQRDLAAGRPQEEPESHWIDDWTRLTHLSRDEISLVFAIIIDAHLKTEQNDREFGRLRQQYWNDPNPSTLAQLQRNKLSGAAIFRQAFSQIQSDLGDADYAILSKTIDQQYCAHCYMQMVNPPLNTPSSQPQ